MTEVYWNGKPYPSIQELAWAKGWNYPKAWRIVRILKCSSDADLEARKEKVSVNQLGKTVMKMFAPKKKRKKYTKTPRKPLVSGEKQKNYEDFIKWLESTKE